MGNLVAIVGMPFVGKSTFFIRLVGWRHAIVDEVAGVTRDRIYGKSDWNGKEFSVIDTGGWVENSDDIFEEEIRKQVLIAIDEADVITFLVDRPRGHYRYGYYSGWDYWANSKTVYLVANKVDNNAIRMQAAEFYKRAWRSMVCFIHQWLRHRRFARWYA